jgi:hypothetical protein
MTYVITNLGQKPETVEVSNTRSIIDFFEKACSFEVNASSPHNNSNLEIQSGSLILNGGNRQVDGFTLLSPFSCFFLMNPIDCSPICLETL